MKKNTVTITLSAQQFTELMRLFDWRWQFVNVDHKSVKQLWAVIVRQTGGIPVPAYDQGELDPPTFPENRVLREDQAVPNERPWYQKAFDYLVNR